MSSTIIYHQLGVCFPKAYTGHSEDLFAILEQSGASNSYEIGRGPNGCGRRTRDWSAAAFGTAEQVLLASIRSSGHCEGGMVKMRSASGYVTPEQYITKVRNLLKAAPANDITKGPILFKDGYVYGQFVLGRDTPDQKLVPIHDQAAIQELFRSEKFWDQVKTAYAWQYMKVSGPELRG